MIRLLTLARAAFEREESTAYAKGYSHGCAGMASLEWDCDPEHAPAAIGYMRHATRPPRGSFEVQACDTLARAWLALPGADTAVWVRVARLARGGV